MSNWNEDFHNQMAAAREAARALSNRDLAERLDVISGQVETVEDAAFVDVAAERLRASDHSPKPPSRRRYLIVLAAITLALSVAAQLFNSRVEQSTGNVQATNDQTRPVESHFCHDTIFSPRTAPDAVDATGTVRAWRLQSGTMAIAVSRSLWVPNSACMGALEGAIHTTSVFEKDQWMDVIEVEDQGAKRSVTLSPVAK